MKHIIFIICLISISFNIQAQQTPKTPKLIVSITLNNFYPEWMQMYQHRFVDGGLRRIMGSGQCLTATYDYLYSQKGTDLVSLYSGCNPDKHGIIAEEWYDRLYNKRVHNSRTKNYRVLGSESRSIYAPDKLRTLSFGSIMKMSNPYAKVYGVAIDGESAVLSAGNNANAAYWFTEERGNWVTSTYYTTMIPTWLESFNKQVNPEYYIRRGWIPFDKENAKNKNMSEKDVFYYNLTELKKKYRTYKVLNATPYANTLVTDMAMKLITEEGMGRDNDTDLLTVCYSALDYMNDDYSVMAPEFGDLIQRFDRDIKRFLEHLDLRVGRDNYTVLLTFTEARDLLPQDLTNVRINGDYFSIYKAVALLKSYLNVLLGTGEWILSYDSGQLFLNQKLIEQRKLKLGDVQRSVADFLAQFEGVYKVLTADDLGHHGFPEGLGQKMQNGFSQQRSGDVLFSLLPAWVPERKNQEDSYMYYSKRTSVPFYIYGVGTGRINKNNCRITDIVPTLCKMMQINTSVTMDGIALPIL